jgi:hypothetical protein
MQMTVDNLAELLQKAVEIQDSKPTAAAEALLTVINSSSM